MKDIKGIEVSQTNDLVKVVVTATNFMQTTFIFSGYHITCFGDIAPFTWHCSWKTAKQILLGNCYADNPYYLTEKLEHKTELKEFDEDLFVNKMEEIKQECLDSCDTEEEKDEFLEKWEDNDYLLSDVDGNRLGNLDDFFNELEIDDYYEYYDDFFKLPDHYNYALEFLKEIEKYFKEKLNETREQ